jgi:N-acetyl-gamma-glutamylphosphate reductase
MRNRALTFLSLAISLLALGYAAWLHQHSEQIAQQALREREHQFVRTFAPRVQSMYQGLGVTNVVGDAQTLEELFGPYVDVFNRMAGDPGEDEKQTP